MHFHKITLNNIIAHSKETPIFSMDMLLLGLLSIYLIYLPSKLQIFLRFFPSFKYISSVLFSNNYPEYLPIFMPHLNSPHS
jgi:hypothetical protein